MQQQTQSKEQMIIKHIEKFMFIVWPGESLHKICERYAIDWTIELIQQWTIKDWVYLWDKLCVTEQKRANAWIVQIADKEIESVTETTQ